MEILKAEQEEAQSELMHYMMTANMEELRKYREAIFQQTQTLKESMEQMRQSIEKRNDQIVELQKQIVALENRPLPRLKTRGNFVIS